MWIYDIKHSFVWKSFKLLILFWMQRLNIAILVIKGKNNLEHRKPRIALYLLRQARSFCLYTNMWHIKKFSALLSVCLMLYCCGWVSRMLPDCYIKFTWHLIFADLKCLSLFSLKKEWEIIYCCLETQYQNYYFLILQLSRHPSLY